MKYLLLFLIPFLLTACGQGLGGDIPTIKEIKPELKLKAPKEKLLGKRKKDNVVQYAYNSDIEILDEIGELPEKRTKVSRQYYTNTYRDDGAENFETVIIPGPQYYYDGKDWWQAEYGTTTDEAYIEQTETLTFFERLFSPALADDTSFFPDGSSVDGYSGYKSTSDTWNNTHGDIDHGGVTDGNETYDNLGTGTSPEVALDAAGTAFYRIGHGFYVWDVSNLSGQDASAAIISIVASGKREGIIANWEAAFYLSNPASDTALVNADYDQVGSTAYTDTVAHDDIVIDGTTYTDWTCNSTCITALQAAIDGDGIFKTSFRLTYEAADSDPGTSGAWEYDYIVTRFSEEDGTSIDPKLTVTHAEAAGDSAPIGASIMGMPF